MAANRENAPAGYGSIASIMWICRDRHGGLRIKNMTSMSGMR